MNDRPKRRLTVDYDAPVILTMTILSLIVLLLDSLLAGAPNALLFSTYKTSLSDPLFYVRLITHIIGHADFAHFFSNMSLLLIIAPTVERRYGSLDIFFAVIFTAAAEGIIHCIFFPTTALLGASGIVFMFIFLAAAENIGDGKLSLTFVFVALIYFGREIYNGIAVADSISQLCHITGGVCGIIVGYFMRKRPHRHPRH